MRTKMADWLNDRSDENLVLFYSEELRAILSGVRPREVLTNYTVMKLRQVGAIITNKCKPAQVTDWARRILEDYS